MTRVGAKPALPVEKGWGLEIELNDLAEVLINHASIMKPQYKLWTLRSMELPDCWTHRCVGRVLSPDPQGDPQELYVRTLPLCLFVWLVLICILHKKTVILSIASCWTWKAHRKPQICGQLVRRAGGLGNSKLTARVWSECKSIWGLCHHTCGVYTNSGGLGQNLIVLEREVLEMS